MKLIIPTALKAILLGSVIGGVSSVMLSLTLEPEISEIRMGQYGSFIGLIASATAVATLTASDANKAQLKDDSNLSKPIQQSENNPFLQELVRDAAENHLNSLQPGSSEYFSALELYGKMLSPESTTPNTKTRKAKMPHHIQEG